MKKRIFLISLSVFLTLVSIIILTIAMIYLVYYITSSSCVMNLFGFTLTSLCGLTIHHPLHPDNIGDFFGWALVWIGFPLCMLGISYKISKNLLLERVDIFLGYYAFFFALISSLMIEPVLFLLFCTIILIIVFGK